jgi:hypothetical protein
MRINGLLSKQECLINQQLKNKVAMEEQQKIQRIKDMVRQYEYEKFDAELRLGVYSAMGREDNLEYLTKQASEADKALAYLAEELAKYPESTESEPTL